LGLEGNIRVLAFQLLLSQIGFGMIYVIWQPYILSTGISIMQLGVIQSSINLSTGAGLIVWGQLSDRFGRRPVVIVAEICRLIALVAMLLAQNLVLFLVFAFFVGFSALWMQGNPARNALVYESADESSVGRAYSTLSAVSQITSTIMASAGGYLALRLGYRPIFYVALLGELSGVILLTIFLRETHQTSGMDEQSMEEDKMLVKYLLPERRNINLYLLMAVMGFSYTTGYSIWYGTLVDDFGFNTFQLGLLSTSFNLGWALASIPLGSFSDVHGKKKALMASWAMAMLSTLGFLLSRSLPMFILFQLVSALDISFWIPAWSSLVASRVESSKRSTVFGKIDAYGKIAGIPAPWIAGLVYEGYGYMAPILVHFFCLLITGALIYRISKDPDID